MSNMEKSLHDLLKIELDALDICSFFDFVRGRCRARGYAMGCHLPKAHTGQKFPQKPSAGGKWLL